MDRRNKKLTGLILLILGVSVLADWGYSYLIPSISDQGVGATLTQLTSTDKLSDFPTTYNANLTELNEQKLEISTTTLPLLTTLANLSTVGTITTGTWNADAIAVAYQGTGTTSPSTNYLMVGNGSSGFRVPANGLGTSGQFLTSQGAGSPPQWTTSSVDEGGNYNWTGFHTFTSLFSASSTLTSATTTNATSTNMRVTGDFNVIGATVHGLRKTAFMDDPDYTVTDASGEQFSTTSAMTFAAGELTASTTLRTLFEADWREQGADGNATLDFELVAVVGSVDSGTYTTITSCANTQNNTEAYIRAEVNATQNTAGTIIYDCHQIEETDGLLTPTDPATSTFDLTQAFTLYGRIHLTPAGTADDILNTFTAHVEVTP